MTKRAKPVAWRKVPAMWRRIVMSEISCMVGDTFGPDDDGDELKLYRAYRAAIAILKAAAKPTNGCDVHAGMVHGKEAEELRTGIEAILESEDDDVEEVHERLIHLLDTTDARDSVAFVEAAARKPATKAKRVQR